MVCGGVQLSLYSCLTFCLTGVLVNSKTITVRFSLQLYDKVLQHELSNSDLIRTSVIQYFSSAGPTPPVGDAGNTTSYDTELFNALNSQILELKNDKQYLQNQVNALMLSSIPLLSRVKLKLLQRKV